MRLVDLATPDCSMRALTYFVIAALVLLAAALPTRGAADERGRGEPITTGQAGAPAPSAAPSPQDESPAAKMARRFPQKVRVGDLIGLPILDDNDVTLGHVQQVVRDPQGNIKLIVSYSPWFGWFGRPVAVPIEVVAILGRQIASLDMEPPAYAKAPTWMPGTDARIADNDMIRIALTRR
jgi:hypothetical protein